jgi:hypothetical protein
MNERNTLAADIEKLSKLYNPEVARLDLDNWIFNVLNQTYRNKAEKELFRLQFKGASILYVPSIETFNLCKTIETKSSTKVEEVSLDLGVYLDFHYGIRSLADARATLTFSEFDFELMALQIAEAIEKWIIQGETGQSKQQQNKQKAM